MLLETLKMETQKASENARLFRALPFCCGNEPVKRTKGKQKRSIATVRLETFKKLDANTTLGVVKSGFAFDKFVLNRLIGKGSYGHIWCGKHRVTEQEVAVKIEYKSNYIKSQLKTEFTVYQMLASGWGSSGLPKLYFAGESAFFRVLVMELVGGTIEDLFNKCGRQLTLKTILMVFDQLLTRLGELIIS